jgi:hypothetical protein
MCGRVRRSGLEADLVTCGGLPSFCEALTCDDAFYRTLTVPSRTTMNCAMLATARRASRRGLGALPVPAGPGLVVETVSMGGSCVVPRLCDVAFRAAR